MSRQSLMGFNDEAPKGKDVKDTSMLNTTARETYATGKNSLKRYTTKSGGPGKLGIKGHPG